MWAMRDMTDIELYWVAGLLEGEGCFNVSFAGSFRVTVKCNMTDEDVIRRLHKIVGAGTVRGPVEKKAQNGRGKPQWIWTLGRTQGAEELMRALHPLMGTRRAAKIDAILRLLAERPPREPKHGTVHMYEAHACRCDECRSAIAAKARRYRSTRLSEPRPLKHGTRNAYERQLCRCDECVMYMRSIGRLRARSVGTLADGTVISTSGVTG